MMQLVNKYMEVTGFEPVCADTRVYVGRRGIKLSSATCITKNSFTVNNVVSNVDILTWCSSQHRVGFKFKFALPRR